MKMIKINEGQRGAAGNYLQSRLLTASASAITWQSTETPSPFIAESNMSRPPATRAAAAACTQALNERRGALDAAAAMRGNAPQNQQPFPAARVKQTAHASLASQAQRTAQHARCCSRTCTLRTRPRVTRSIIHAAQRPFVLYITCTPAGAVASRRHAVATQPHMTRTGTHGENSVSM